MGTYTSVRMNLMTVVYVPIVIYNHQISSFTLISASASFLYSST